MFRLVPVFTTSVLTSAALLTSSSAYAGVIPIPEPGSLGLLAGVAIVGIVAYRLRKRK